MKAWKNPEVKVFDMKMDENIAASGEYETRTITLKVAGNLKAEGTWTFNVTGSTIVLTGIPYNKNGNAAATYDEVESCAVK